MRIVIPPSLLKKHPDLTLHEIRAIVKVFVGYKTYKLKGSRMVDFNWHGVGRLRSHGNKKKKKYRRLDKWKKRRKQQKLLLTKERLLF